MTKPQDKTKGRIYIIIPSATEDDWRWRQYKAYIAICGDCEFVTTATANGMRAVIGSSKLANREAA